MKYLAIMFFAIMLFPAIAKAEIKNQDIIKFNDDYVEMYKSCNLSKIIPYLRKHYADNYVMQLRLPNGETRQATRDDLESMATQGIRMMTQINGANSDCRPDMTMGEIKTSGDRATAMITQHEQLSMPQNGQMVTVKANTACNHLMEKQKDGTVRILQSKCVLYQEQ